MHISNIRAIRRLPQSFCPSKNCLLLQWNLSAMVTLGTILSGCSTALGGLLIEVGGALMDGLWDLSYWLAYRG